ncbi:MAG: hypothetical protein H0T71_10195 [Acidobacteria bacterium]|nr:hypothetical protein [Acidobacteriota bacterium]
MKLIFGGVVAVILLGLYAYSVWFAVDVVNCINTPGCMRLTGASFSSGFASTLSTVGGLVSALVIAELAITKPGEAPVARALEMTPSPATKNALKVVTGAYLLVWVALGLTAYVVGGMWYPDALRPLTDFGQAWLGLAVAAAYAYFGINEPTSV